MELVPLAQTLMGIKAAPFPCQHFTFQAQSFQLPPLLPGTTLDITKIFAFTSHLGRRYVYLRKRYIL